MKGIVFDKDGTLIDFYKTWGPTVRPVIMKIIEDVGLEQTEALIMELERSIGVIDGIILPEGSFSYKTFDEISEDLYNRLIKYEIKIQKDLFSKKVEEYFTKEILNRNSFETFCDIKQLFTRLKDLGMKIAVATTDNLQSTTCCFEKLGVWEQIDFLATADNGCPIKPDGALLDMIARAFKCNTMELIVVGDTPNDMRFARSAGAVSIGVLSGTGDYDSLKDCAEIIVESVKELIETLNTNNLVKE